MYFAFRISFRSYIIPAESLRKLVYRRSSSKSYHAMDASGATYAGQNRYLFYYAQEHTEFRFAELRSLCKLLNIKFKEEQLIREECPFLLLDLPSDREARMLVQRSVLMRSCFECWLQSGTMDNLLERMQNLSADQMAKYSGPESSFRLRINAYGKKFGSKDVLQRIQALKVFPLDVKVDLHNAMHSFHLMEDYGGESLYTYAPDVPEQIFFGRWLADSDRDAANTLRLDERYFIGTTSMDPLLALVMANQALVSSGSLVYDPFVGTGSLLVAAAHFGGYVLGADIDRTLLHGRGKSTRAKNTWRKSDESVLANFKQYGLEQRYLDVLVANVASRILRDDVQFDAIISDPPYGVREPIARVGKGKSDSPVEDSIPSTTSSFGPEFQLGRCDLNDLIVTLVSLAAKHLRMGGRLVYWLPVLQDEYNESAVPRHGCFDILSNSEQRLAGATSRRLITMEKVKEWNPDYEVTFAKEIYTETFRERYFNAIKDKDFPRPRPNSMVSRKARAAEAQQVVKVPVCQ